MILYTERISSRLTYIAEFLSREILEEALVITRDPNHFQQYEGPRINYSPQVLTDREIRIPPEGLLFETGIQTRNIEMKQWENLPVFFSTPGDIPFDLLSASFYLISRYEEYGPYQKDEYGRYGHTNSLAFQQGFLHRPLVNEWIQAFKKQIQVQFPDFSFRPRVFDLLPTYDIDIAYSFKGKGFWRNTAGALASLIQGKWSSFRHRLAVLNGKSPDPYDAYAWLEELHIQTEYPAIYFFHLGKKQAGYDKSISPSQPVLQQLIRETASHVSVGIHPSWRSGDQEELLREEMDQLAKLTGKEVTLSRFHYIRFQLPHSYRRLIRDGIKQDHSMGYGSINGFRASVASPFYWYDLEKEERTGLLLYPFCFMDANSFFEQKQTAAEAGEEMKGYAERVRNVEGMMVMIWHNNFLGTDPAFSGWREGYAQFLLSQQSL